MQYTLENLATHMLQHKDGVILYGSKISKAYNNNAVPYDYAEKFSRKYQRKFSNEFLDYFMKNIYINPEDVSNSMLKIGYLDSLCQEGVIKTIIDLNNDGVLKYQNPSLSYIIELHGSMQDFVCDNKNCHKYYPANEIISNNNLMLKKCPECGSYIRPASLLNGENYNDDLFYQARKKVAESHTLITLDIDYSEEAICNLIGEFDNSRKLSSETKMLVAIHSEDLDFNLNDLAFHDFIGHGNAFDKLSLINDTVLKVAQSYNE